MSLLREIQNSAIDSNTELAVLLRKCKVLAARLGNADFKQWIEHELNGYPNIDELPKYRILSVNSKGHFSGAFGSGLRNADIPLFNIEQELKNRLNKSYLNGSVASMESLVKNSSGGVAQEPWPPEIVAYFGHKIYENMQCMQAWKVVPISGVVAALDAVRNRILNFVLEIESENPEAGEAPMNSDPLPQEKVNQIFNTYITGNVQNVSTGSTNVNQSAKYIENNSEELFIKLIEALEKSNQNENVIALLSSQVREMQSSKGTPSFKQHYQNFMSVLSDHIQVFGPVVAPYIAPLTQLLS